MAVLNGAVRRGRRIERPQARKTRLKLGCFAQINRTKTGPDKSDINRRRYFFRAETWRGKTGKSRFAPDANTEYMDSVFLGCNKKYIGAVDRLNRI